MSAGLGSELAAHLGGQPPAVRPARRPTLRRLHGRAHLREPGGAGLRDRSPDQLGDLLVRQLGGQVAVEDRALGPLPLGQLGPVRGAERLRRLPPLLRLRTSTLSTSLSASCRALDPETSSVVIAASAIRSVAVATSSRARIAPVRSAWRRSLSSLTPE